MVTMRFLSTGTAMALILWSSVVSAQPSLSTREIVKLKADMAKQQEQLQQQQAQIVKQQDLLKQQEAVLAQQREQFGALSTKLDHFVSTPIAEMQMGEMRGARKNTVAPSVDPSVAVPQVVASDRKPTSPERPQEIAAYIEAGGILLPKGNLVITPEVSYLNSSATRVAIEGFSIIPALNIGLFEVSELARNSLTSAVSGRYGVTNRFEIEAKVPYLYREDSTRNRPLGVGSSSDVLTRVDGQGLGDIELGAHYQVNDGKDNWPYFISNLRFKTTTGSSPFEMKTDPATGLQTELPTGSGFYALQPSVTMIYPSDPGIFYSNLGYLFNFEDSAGGRFGKINPGDSINASLGLSVALNDSSSFSLGYSHNTVFKTEQNGNVIPNSRNLQLGTLDLGYAFRVSDATSLNFNVSAGVTEDAPDANVILRIPIRFDSF
jgi:hypothetical protein